MEKPKKVERMKAILVFLQRFTIIMIKKGSRNLQNTKIIKGSVKFWVFTTKYETFLINFGVL